MPSTLGPSHPPEPIKDITERTSPGRCHARRGRSRRAHRVCHPGPCQPPAVGTPSQAVSSRVHTVYLGRKMLVDIDTGRVVWSQGTSRCTWVTGKSEGRLQVKVPATWWASSRPGTCCTEHGRSPPTGVNGNMGRSVLSILGSVTASPLPYGSRQEAAGSKDCALTSVYTQCVSSVSQERNCDRSGDGGGGGR